MNIREGDQVLVNLAPFIGSPRRNKEAIPCRVVAIDGPHVEIRTGSPYREFSLRVQRTWIEGQFGARASKLYQLLDQGHHDVKLSAEDMRRITLWLDCNSDFFVAYEQTKEQSQGEVVVPSLE